MHTNVAQERATLGRLSGAQTRGQQGPLIILWDDAYTPKSLVPTNE
jgi:hypothetical protein